MSVYSTYHKWFLNILLKVDGVKFDTMEMKCIIHHPSVGEKEKLVCLTDKTSWKRLLTVAIARQHMPLLDIAKKTQEDCVPQIYYHSTCRNRFTKKRDLDAMKENDVTEPAPKRRSLREEKPESATVYDPTCVFCPPNKSKYKKGTRTREKLRTCSELRSDKKLRDIAHERGDAKLLAITSRELVGAEAHYHHSCYTDYTREKTRHQSATKAQLTSKEDAYIVAEINAYKDLFAYIRNTIFQDPCVVKLSALTERVVHSMTVAGITDIRQSTKKHIRRKLESEFGESIHFTTYERKVLVFPITLSIDDFARKMAELEEKIESLKASIYDSSEDAVQHAAKHIYALLKNQVNDTQWPPEPRNTNKESVSLPQPLITFLQLLLTGELSTPSERIARLISSIGQDIIFGATRGQVKPPKHVLLPYAIKSLTGNVELITILNRLGAGLSYTQLSEIDTALCLRKLALITPDVEIALPESVQPYVNTTVCFDNIDRMEETLSGSGTSHRVNGIIIQPKVFGPQLPPKPLIQIDKSKKRSLHDVIDDLHLPAYNAGEKSGPPLRPGLDDVDVDIMAREAWKKS